LNVLLTPLHIDEVDKNIEYFLRYKLKLKLKINKTGKIIMKTIEKNKRVFARKVATKSTLTEKEMQQVSGGDTRPSGPRTPIEERNTENLH
jgi:bacteriocin-like protein